MSVAKIIEISSESSQSFEDAIAKGIAKASESLDGIRKRVDCRAEGDGR
ncbi:MAG: dodecin domain-containing protein [Xanthomonadaceae bacterium]|nr:dodecin domain-containing protein [Xanthomonadaceae bacterium]